MQGREPLFERRRVCRVIAVDDSGLRSRDIRNCFPPEFRKFYVILKNVFLLENFFGKRIFVLQEVIDLSNLFNTIQYDGKTFLWIAVLYNFIVNLNLSPKSNLFCCCCRGAFFFWSNTKGLRKKESIAEKEIYHSSIGTAFDIILVTWFPQTFIY